MKHFGALRITVLLFLLTSFPYSAQAAFWMQETEIPQEETPPTSPSTDVVVPAVESTREEMLRHHAQALVSLWQEGDVESARAQWGVLHALMHEGETLDSWFDPALAETTLQEMKKTFEEDMESEPVEGTGRISVGEEATASAPAPLKPLTGLEREWLQGEIRIILREFGEVRNIHFPAQFLADVETYVQRFTQPGNLRSWYGRALDRMDKYYPTIQGTFSKRKLPEGFYYLALVESAFNPNARSSSGAVGVWQFMPDTGRQYGLRIDRNLDQRRDPQLSTEAAREYLLDLIMDFGDGHSMLLAMAAYNAGEGRIRSRLRQLDDFQDRNFWSLAGRGLLPEETRTYIPKILAAAIIGRNRSRFGFPPGRSMESSARLVLQRPVSIPHLLTTGGMTQEVLERFNPDLDVGMLATPARTHYELVVPKVVAQRLQQDKIIQQAMIAPEEIEMATASPETPDEERGGESYLVYRVQPGNSWESISHWSGLSVAKLKADNPFHGSGPPVAGKALYLRGISDDLKPYVHPLQAKEKLPEVAALYGVELENLRSWNNLDETSPQTGYPLMVYARSQSEAAANHSSEQNPSSIVPESLPTSDTKRDSRFPLRLVPPLQKAESSPKTRKGLPLSANRSSPQKNQGLRFTVLPRNTLGSISNAFATTIPEIKNANGLRKETVTPGQALLIPVRGWEKISHRVRPGETLEMVATRFGSNARAMMTFNGLRNSRIQVGEEVVIYRPKK